MKLHFVVLLALLVSQGFAQAAAPQSNPPVSSEPAAASSKPVAPDAAVISVAGICRTPSAKGECQTVITRTEFEKLMSLLSRQRNGQAPESVPLEAKRQLAIQYSRLLLFGDLAEKQGLQNTPEGKELIHFLRLQALTEELARTLQQKSAPTPEEARSFYDHNPERYTEWHLQRVVVPLSAGAESQQKAELKKLAEDFRQRASAGGDFDVLQKQAFEKTGIKNPPQAKLVLMPGTPLPEAQSAVYRLKPGELSPVIEDSNGFYIYKLDSSRLTPFEQNKAEIQEFLAGQKAQQAIQRLLESNTVTLNSDYFEPVRQNAAPKTSSLQPAGSVAQAKMR
jgi:parvulin-like peptidyl-prolyl isomerase